MTDAPKYLRAADIARLSGASVRTARRWIADRIVPSVKVRGMRLVPRKALEQVLSPAPLDWDEPDSKDSGKSGLVSNRESTRTRNVPSLVE